MRETTAGTARPSKRLSAAIVVVYLLHRGVVQRRQRGVAGVGGGTSNSTRVSALWLGVGRPDEGQRPLSDASPLRRKRPQSTNRPPDCGAAVIAAAVALVP